MVENEFIKALAYEVAMICHIRCMGYKKLQLGNTKYVNYAIRICTTIIDSNRALLFSDMSLKVNVTITSGCGM